MMRFMTDDVEKFGKMVSQAVKDGLTFEAHTEGCWYVLVYSGGY